MSRDRLRASLLLVVTLATLADLVFVSTQAQWLAMVALGGYLLTLRGLSTMARILLGAAALLSLVALWHHPASLALLRESAGRFAFFATFLVALGLLRLPAYRSRLVNRCGHAMLLQPPSRRYPILSLGSALFGIILNIGVLNLVAAMIEKSNTLAAAQGRLWVQKARQRRMMLALLRGFSLAPLVSPMGIGMAVVLSSMEGLRWIELAPYALGAALVLFLVGWGVANSDVTCNTYLTAKHTPLAHLGASCDTYLRRHHGVLANISVVSYLNEVVEFHTLTDIGTSHSRTVNTSVGTYLYIVLNGDNAYLRNLVVTVGTRCKAESIGTYYTACMKSYVVAQLAAMINSHVRIDECVLSYLDTFANVGMRINLAAFAHLSSIADISKSSYVNTLGYLSLGRNESQWIYASLLRLH